jgi:GR25 family glycosyltransferase involved in LPS biosynthesis/GT2 family glycosyltransferase/tetratricopeptide (TPR) repeat protein
MAPEAGAAAAPPRGVRPTICLNMIVRNEAHVITATLDTVCPFLDYWVIVDTGSTDDTKAVIRAYFSERGIPGELHERPWRNFGENRTEALALARGKADYVWVVDADDLVVGTLDLSALTLDCYQLRFGSDFVYWRAQIFRGSLEWAYRGVVHEYAVGLQATYTEGRLEGDYYVESRRLGDRNRAPDKYPRDCRLLLEYLADHPDDPRAVFYLAQSYFDAGDAREALRYYTRRSELGGWPEEVYYALFRRAVCLDRLAEPWALCQDAYLAAWQARPTRAEPLHALARRHRVEGRYDAGYLFARAATEIAWPDDRLFVAADVYRWRSADERSICAYYTGRHRESLDLCAQLLDNPHLPDAERDRVMGNRDVAVARVIDEEPPYPHAVVQQIMNRPATTQPRVTLTMTSCKRPHLFARTVNSFLACCEDVDQIGRWLLVDDGSTPEDRAWMADRYPFFECVWKTRADRGHARSMNLILDRLDTPYWLHLEDDWQFFVRDRYVAKALAILGDDPSLGQVLFNRNYGETLACRDTAGGFVKRTRREGLRYRLHEHVPPDSPQYADALRRLPPGAGSMLYWPHYSLRPALARVAAIRDVGRYDPDAGHFEHDFAVRYRDKGYQSAFLDAIHCRHLGRLTSERGPEATPNAYDLNNEPQFSRRQPGRTRRVKLVGEAAANPPGRWIRQSRHDGEWEDVVVTRDDVDIDYFAVLGRPGGEPFDPQRSIVFPLEPETDAEPAGPAARLDRRGFVQVRTHDRYRHIGEWRLDRSWAELISSPIEKSRARAIAAAVGEADPGHRLGREFLDHLARHGVETSVYARGDSAGLLPYGYAIAVEGAAHPNYVTDVFFDALVAECLCFYWGCPNLEEHIDPSVFIRLPIEDVEASRRIVEEAVRGDLRAQRLDAIRREKRRFLKQGQFLPTLARVIRGHEFARSLPVKVLNLNRRPDRWRRFRHAAFAAAGVFVARCERVPAVDGQALELTPEIQHTFRGNDFAYRRGIVGCALSHLAIWKTIANGGTASLILEDDARLTPDFLGQLVEVCGLLCDKHPDFHVVLLGIFPWTEEQRRELSEQRGVRLRPMDWSSFLGGAFAYLMSPHGARTLLALAERDGVQNGIDWFMMRKAEHLKVLQAVPQLITSALASPGGSVDSDIQHDFAPVPQPQPRGEAVPNTVRVKLIGDWCTSEQLCREWNHMSQGHFRWNDIEVTWDDRDVDFYVIINRPARGELYDPARTIVFQMEPWCGLEHQTWGVKTWGEWAVPDRAKFLQVRTHATHLNNAFWQLRSTYDELKTMPIVKTRLLSTICSSKYFDPGHIARVDFLRYLEAKHDDVVQIDIFGYENSLGFGSYRGPLPPGEKEAGLLPYKYCFLAENNQERNFVTEKLWEPLLTETLCFYSGCPNVSEHIDPRAYIELDLSDFEQSFQIIKQAIMANEWERRLDVIRQEKHRVLDHHQFFPTLERVLQRDFTMPVRPSDDEVIYHKYFSAVAGRRIQTACFVHSCTLRGDTRILRQILRTIEDSGLLDRLDSVYVVNVGDEVEAGDLGVDVSRMVRVINYSSDVAVHEQPTVDLLHRFARVHRESRILYVHTKGVSYDPPRQCVEDWRAYLLYFLVEHHETCLAALDAYDVVGCNRLAHPRSHYGGNFWWANARYVAALPTVPSDTRHNAEWWVLGCEGTQALSLWESGVNHYEQPYPRHLYDTDDARRTLAQWVKSPAPTPGDTGMLRRSPSS